MGSTLYIRHLSNKLTTDEREDLLKHFGAQRVWFINKNSNTAFAQFNSIPVAKQALYRLHQLEVLGKRLVVEYANEKDREKPKSDEICPSEAKHENECVDTLNSWNSSLNFKQPPPPHLRYKYPPPTPSILFNIIERLLKNSCFYTQTLHSMNKMSLDPPFSDVSEETISLIKTGLISLGVQLSNSENNNGQVSKDNIINNDNGEQISSEDESEISSDENIPTVDAPVTKIPVKRKANVKRVNKIPKLSLQMQIMNTSKSKKNKLKTEDVFEDSHVQQTKRIEFNVNSTQLPSASDVQEENVGEIGKMEPVKSTNMDKVDSIEDPCEISHEDLTKNRISPDDMKLLPVFKNYNPGPPSNKIYIKNLAKDVEVLDLEKIYKRYLVNCDLIDKDKFDIRLMQEGRMKGQAFVTFPNVEVCERALNETNGFMLKSKPMVVLFSKATK